MRQDRALTTLGLQALENRVRVIDAILDICDPDFDSDVIENLDKELTEIMAVLTCSYAIARAREAGIRVL